MGCLSPWGAYLILNNAFPILLSTFYPNLKLLNDHHFKGGAAPCFVMTTNYEPKSDHLRFASELQ